jgi:hypothetical protein
MLSQILLCVTMNRHSRRINWNVMIQKHSEWLSNCIPSIHQLSRHLDNVDRLVETVSLGINDYPACSFRGSSCISSHHQAFYKFDIALGEVSCRVEPCKERV